MKHKHINKAARVSAALFSMILATLFVIPAFAQEESMPTEFKFTHRTDAVSYQIDVDGETVAFFSVDSFTRDVVRRSGAHGSTAIWMPKNAEKLPVENIRVPLIVAVHGSGRATEDYRDEPFYAEQRKIANQNGYAFAVISNGTDTWGTDAGVENLTTFLTHLTETTPSCTTLGLWATSAGGVTALRTIAESDIDVDFMIGTFTVYDLLIEHKTLASCRRAWGDISYDAFAALVKGKNPPDQIDAIKASGCRFYLTHGDKDAAVPYEANPLRMAEELGDAVMLETIPDGVHGTKNFDFYGKAVEAAFADHPAEYAYTGPIAPGNRITLTVTAKDGSATVEDYTVTDDGSVIPYTPSAETETTADSAVPGGTDTEKKPSKVLPILLGTLAVILCGGAVGVGVHRRKRKNK